MLEAQEVCGTHECVSDIFKMVAERVKRSESRVSAAIAEVVKDLDQMRSRVDATHSAVMQWHSVEDALKAKSSAMRLDINDMQKAMCKMHEELQQFRPWVLEEMQARDDSLDMRISTTIEHDPNGVAKAHEQIQQIKPWVLAEMRTREEALDLRIRRTEMRTREEATKQEVDLDERICKAIERELKASSREWEDGNGNLMNAVNAVDAKLSSLDSAQRRADKVMTDIQNEIAALEMNLEKSGNKADDGQHAEVLSSQIKACCEDIVLTQDGLEIVENSVSSCFDELDGLRRDMEQRVEQRVAAIEARMKSGNKRVLEALAEISALDQHVDTPCFEPLQSSTVTRRTKNSDQENRPPLQEKFSTPQSDNKLGAMTHLGA
jgi:chromosome segregation ATPase